MRFVEKWVHVLVWKKRAWFSSWVLDFLTCNSVFVVLLSCFAVFSGAWLLVVLLFWWVCFIWRYFSAFKQARCTLDTCGHEWVTVAFRNMLQYPPKWCTYSAKWLCHGGFHLCAHSVHIIQVCTSLLCTVVFGATYFISGLPVHAGFF